MTAHFGSEVKSVTISRNGRSRSSGITGHDRPEWAVMMGRNTQQEIQKIMQKGRKKDHDELPDLFSL